MKNPGKEISSESSEPTPEQQFIRDLNLDIEITFQALMQSLKNDEDLVDTYTTLNTFWALYETQKESNTINLGISPRYVEVTLPQKSN